MIQHTEKKAKNVLFRLKAQDTPNGISEETFDLLILKLGLSQTDVMHLALKKLAEEQLPAYEADDADLTDAQIQYLRETSPAKDIPEERFMKLF
ncbi:hypothetical protein ACNPNM_08540 [Klebsiella variicola]|uniref:hypothetical protein n=1 Tax=Klebsiella pneumoniae complex TaxID=3390273 RepID=UPI003003C190